jgi:prepilin-type N-terminal cleavage/methylation domain-containing protein
MNIKKRQGFTLVEIMTVVAIIAVLAVTVIYTLNPTQFFAQGRDGNRVAGIGTLNKAVSLYYSDAMNNPSTLFMGTSSVVYVSIPDPTAKTTAGTNCSSLGFVSTASTTYHCAAPSNYLKTDGTGWVPINFNAYPGGSVMSALPVDPINTATSGEYYVYTTNGVGGYEIMAQPQAAKDASNTATFVKGTDLSLLTSFPGTESGTSGQNIWVADYGNNRVEEFSPSGAYLSQFGTAGSGNGQFSGPTGIAVDASGNIWVVDYGNDRVEEFSPSGAYLSQFGSYGTGNGQFVLPESIAIDASGNILVADYWNNRVEEFSPSGAYLSQFGTAGSGNGQFSGPGEIAFNPYTGNIYITDEGNNRVEVFSSSSAYLSQFGSYGTGNGQFSTPYGITYYNGSIWVTDNGNNRVQEFSGGGGGLGVGVYFSQFGTTGSGNGQFSGPESISVDVSGNFWIADYQNNRVEEFSSSSAYISQFGTTGSGNGQFSGPGEIGI